MASCSGGSVFGNQESVATVCCRVAKTGISYQTKFINTNQQEIVLCINLSKVSLNQLKIK